MSELMFHINCRVGDIGKYCILPGDPGRCEKIAAFFDKAEKVSQNREYTVYTGSIGSKTVSVVSTGIGGPSAAIAMEELVMCGADTFIRVGTCGGIELSVDGGDCVIANGAVRQEGTSLEYAPIEFPAVADYSVLFALIESAKGLGLNYHVGVVQSKDSFYGQHNPGRMPVAAALLEKWEAWKRLGVLASEMETAALYTVAASLGVRCGAVFHTIWNKDRETAGLPSHTDHNTENAIKVAINAIKAM